MTIPFEIGQYDYSNLKPSAPAGNPYVVQARSALQIAQMTGAEQVAEADYRQARVALGAMEELITRAAPLDILLPAANEAIRWAQKSVIAAHDRGQVKELEDAKSELVALRAEKQQIDARIQQLTQEQAAATEQIRTLQAAVGSANSEKVAAEERAQNVERKLDELNRKQDELQGSLNLDLRNEYYDDSGLTEAGRDALIRIHNISEVIPGPIRLTGNAPETAIKAATEFLILAGTPQDRITTRR
jgi:chromosome segregation ATPase